MKPIQTPIAALLFLLFLLGLALPAAARVGAEGWRAEPYEHDGLSITAKSAEWKKGKLWLKLQIINLTEQQMNVNPDQLRARLPSGAMVTRSKGVFDKLSSAHAAKAIRPGAGEELAIEFEVGEAERVALQLDFAISVGSKVQKFPEWIASAPPPPPPPPPPTPPPLPASWEQAAPYQHSNLAVTVLAVSKTRGGVELRLKVDNQNDAPIYIDKRLFKARPPSGILISREQTLFKNTLTLLGHSSSELTIEFKLGEPADFSLVLDGINNGVLGLPDLAIRRTQ